MSYINNRSQVQKSNKVKIYIYTVNKHGLLT